MSSRIISQTEKLKHASAREVVLSRIRSGFYRPGQRLPSERELASDLSLSHITVRRGLEDLVDAGVIVKKPRVGNFVQAIQPMELAQRVAIVLPRHMQDEQRPHPVTALLMKGILDEMDQRDYALSLLSYQQEQLWLDAGESMLARGIKGALLYANSDTPADQVAKLVDSGIKIMLINGVGLWPQLRLPSVSIDLLSPMREALEHLIALGHRRIAWLTYDDTRYRAAEEELVGGMARQHGLGSMDQIIYRLDGSLLNFQRLGELFDRRPLSTAMVMQDEFIAHEVFRQCHQRGIRVPEDLSLVSIADSAPQAHLVPLSAPNTAGMWIETARRAAHHLRSLLDSDEDKQIEVVLHAPIQWKKSTARPCKSSLSFSEQRST